MAIVLEQHEEEKRSQKRAVLTSDSRFLLDKPKIVQLGTQGERRSALSSMTPALKRLVQRTIALVSLVGDWDLGLLACDSRFGSSADLQISAYPGACACT